MDGKKFISNTSNHETIEIRPQRDKPKSEPHPLSSLPHNPKFSYIDGDDNSQKTTGDRLPARAIHHINYIPCPPGKDVALSRNNGALVEQDLPPKSIPRTASSEELSSQDTSIHVERNEQAIPPLAIVQPRDNVIWLVHRDKLYSLNSSNKNFLLRLPRATTFLTLNDQSDGETLTLHCSSEEELPNLDATKGAVVPIREHFHYNANKSGYVVYSSDLQRFSGVIRYPLPKKNAEDIRIGFSTNGGSFVFTIFHKGKEYAVKKSVYRPEDVSVYSRLCHPNLVNLEAVLIGQKHEHLNQFYAYYFMTKLSVSLKKVLSANQDGCLEYYNGKAQWRMVLSNVRYILKCVLKAVKYLQLQGVVFKYIKAHNVLINMACPCFGNDVLLCCCGCRTFDVKLSLSSNMVAAYDSLYADGKGVQWFGCLLLDIFMGKSVQGYEDSQDVCYTNYLLSELERCYYDTPELCDLVRKCFQVGVVSSSQDLLRLKFFN